MSCGPIRVASVTPLQAWTVTSAVTSAVDHLRGWEPVTPLVRTVKDGKDGGIWCSVVVVQRAQMTWRHCGRRSIELLSPEPETQVSWNHSFKIKGLLAKFFPSRPGTIRPTIKMLNFYTCYNNHRSIRNATGLFKLQFTIQAFFNIFEKTQGFFRPRLNKPVVKEVK